MGVIDTTSLLTVLYRWTRLIYAGDPVRSWRFVCGVFLIVVLLGLLENFIVEAYSMRMSSSGEVSPVSVTPATTPSLQGTHAPKYGTVIPNRIFVGGIAANTTAQELKQFFSAYGAVQESKIITDRAGISKGYGFITFETLEDAEKIIKKEADNLVFKDRKLNIGPAIKKQAFPRMYEPSVSPGAVMFTNGVPYTYQNGMAFFHPQEGGYPVPAQPQPAYPMMMPTQPMYVSQPGYAYQSPVSTHLHDHGLFNQTAAPTQWNTTQSQWRWTAQSPTSPYMYHALPTVTPEMYSAAQPPPQATYQPSDIADASMMEAAPAELAMNANVRRGSMVMDPSLAHRAYVDANQLYGAPPTVSMATMSPEHIYQQTQMAAPATMVPVQHRTPVAYKRPLPTSSRKILGTPTVSLSPRATPPSKVLITQHRMVNKMTPCGPEVHEIHGHHGDGSAPLTPPPTPEVLHHV